MCIGPWALEMFFSVTQEPKFKFDLIRFRFVFKADTHFHSWKPSSKYIWKDLSLWIYSGNYEVYELQLQIKNFQ